ncbi:MULTISPECIES: recombination regulator RecX [Cupriavidus]|uniref:recombination regulator RecX n=1 Tax=Cupriavidus TaxID=106589 RepID=UPI0007E3E89E|nr:MULTISPECIES: recombination regulator RecX [Cupriavidus]MCD9122900.1 recombination regulator RecX [Cupriavidus sp. UGS-1]
MPRPPLSLKARAVGYLSRREHSRAELARKLAPHAESPEELERLLDTLERENWLSNARFAESLVHRRASRYGASRVMQEARTHQLDGEQLADLQQQLRATELERAREVWRKRFGVAPATPEEKARQLRFLTARGFSQAAISRVIRDADLPPDEQPE